MSTVKKRDELVLVKGDDYSRHLDDSPAAGLLERRREEIQAFMTALNENKMQELVAEDEELFSTIVDLATSDYGIEQKRIADHLGVNPSAVGRWKSREHAPRPYARAAVITVISALVEERLHGGIEQSPGSDGVLAGTQDDKSSN